MTVRSLSNSTAIPNFWNDYSGNPILKAVPGSSSEGNAWASPSYWGGYYHLFASVRNNSTPGIYHWYDTSPLFTNPQGDANNPVVGPGATVYDGNRVTTASAWQENGTVYLLYQGFGSSYLAGAMSLATAPASSPTALTFTKYGSNPVWTGAGGSFSLNQAVETNGGSVIKVGGSLGGPGDGGTYYAFITSAGLDTRQVGIISSTNLHTWSWANSPGTASYPVWTGARFCPAVCKIGDFYYAVVAHYTIKGTASELELYRSRYVTFPAQDREYLGVIRRLHRLGSAFSWEKGTLDVPAVLTDDITKSSFDCTDGRPYLYYSGGNATWLTGVMTPTQAIAPQITGNADKIVHSAGPWAATSLAANTATTPILLNGLKYWNAPCSCSVVYMSAYSDVALTAGSITVTLTDRTGAASSIFYPGTMSCRITSGSFHGAGGEAAAGVEEGSIFLEQGNGVGITIASSSDMATARAAPNVGVTIGVIMH